MGINIGQFLTPYPDFGNEAGAFNAMVSGIGQLGHSKLAHEQMAQQQKQFEDSQRQQSEQFGQQAWSAMMQNNLNAALPLLQKHADLIAEGTEASIAAARELEAGLGQLGYSFLPHEPGGGMGAAGTPGANIAQPNAGESFHDFYGRMSRSAPANIPGAAPPGTEAAPRKEILEAPPQQPAEQSGQKRTRILYSSSPSISMTAPQAVKPTTTVTPAQAAKTTAQAQASLAAAKKAASPIAEQIGQAYEDRNLPDGGGTAPGAEMPGEVQANIQQENARNYGPMFRSAPAILPQPESTAIIDPVTGRQMTASDVLNQESLQRIGISGDTPLYQKRDRMFSEEEMSRMAKAKPNWQPVEGGRIVHRPAPVPTHAPAAAQVPSQQRSQVSAAPAAARPQAAPSGEGLAIPEGQMPQMAQQWNTAPSHLQSYDIYDFTGRKIGESHPEVSYRIQTDRAREMAAGLAAGTDPEFRSLMEGMLKGAKSQAEVMAIVKAFGTPEMQALIAERSNRAAAFAKSQRQGGRANTLDYMSGVTLFEKTLTDQSLKDYTSSYRDFKHAADLLASGNPIATVAVERSVAKAMNGPGVLTDQDADAPKQLLPYREKIMAWVQGKAVGDLPEEIKGQFAEYLSRKAHHLEQEARRSYQNFVDMMQNYGPPSPETRRAAMGAAMPFFRQFGLWNPKDFGEAGTTPAVAPQKSESVSGKIKGKEATRENVHKALGI